MYFRTAAPFPRRIKDVAPHIDICGDGGYVIAAGIVDGLPYVSKGGVEAELPAAWVERLTAARGEPVAGGDDPLAPIPEGRRTKALVAMVGKMRTAGLTADEIAPIIRERNDTLCQPPLSDVELQREVLGAAERFARQDALVLSRVAVPEVTGFTARELLVMDPPKIDSLRVLNREQIVVKGFSHIVAASPKAGKTTLLAHAAGEWDEPVLWLTEESQPVWRYRLLNELRIPDTRLDALHLEFAQGCDPDDLLALAVKGSETVVIVDTVRTLLQLEDENDNSCIARRIAPWVTAMRAAGKTLILVHHNRKGGGDHGEGIAGGSALLASVDLAVMLWRDNHAENRRVIETLGRLVEPVRLLYERDADTKALRPLGDPSALELADVQSRVLEVLEPEVWLTTSQVREKLDPRPSVGQTFNALKALGEAHKVRRDPPLGNDANGKRVGWMPR